MDTLATHPRFDVLLRLGRGGVADVSLARLAGAPRGEEFIVKRLRAELQDDVRVRNALRAEAEIGRSLTDPALPRTLFLGEAEEGPYVAMPYVWGDDLRGLARQDRARVLTPELAAAIGVRAARALDALHEQGLVHRDVSPPNIVVGFDGRVVLIDLGIASSGEASGSKVPEGKFAYMSPEQAHGEVLDARADVFSLALVLYELVTQRRAMRGSTSPGQAVVAARALRPLAALCPDAPPALGEAIDAALRYERDARTPSAAAFADALQAALGEDGPGADEIGEAARTLGRARLAALEDVLGEGYAGPTNAPSPDLFGALATTHDDEADAMADEPDLEFDDAALRSPREGRGILTVFGVIGALLLAFIGYRVATQGVGTQFHADYDPGPSRAEFEAEPLAAPEAPATVASAITSTPGGAHIVVNGVATRERTPASVPLVEGRDNTVTLHLAGHATHRANVRGDGDALDATLAPLPAPTSRATEAAADAAGEGSGTLNVPPGQGLIRVVARDVAGEALDAEVLLNGESGAGNTPATLTVDADTLQHISVRRGGYRDSATYVAVIPYVDERSVREVILEMTADAGGERPRSTLRVRPTPPDATISLDGEDQGRRNVIPLAVPGHYTLALEAPDHEPFIQHVDARLGQFEVHHALVPIRTGPARLTLRVEPADAVVFVERLRHGSAGARQLRSPYRAIELDAGDVQLTLDRRGEEGRWRGRTVLQLEPGVHHTVSAVLSAEGLETEEREREAFEP